MKQEIRDLFHKGILSEAAKRHGVSVEQVRFVKDAENYVYEFERNQQPLILRITHTIRRNPNYIMGELEWLNYLADHGLTVSRAVPSMDGNLIEWIPAKEGRFLAIAYEKAPGKPIGKEDWNESFFQTWGAYVGRMHSLTKQYTLSNPAYKRQEWYEEEQLNLRKYVPEHQTQVMKKTEELMEKLHQLPKGKDSYGLVHADLHQGNFHWDKGKIITFDFDDIGYNWFMNDIAILLYNVQWFPTVPYEDREAFVRHFFTHFMTGYRKENDLDPWWYQYIPDFLRLRHMLLYGLFHQFFDLNDLKDEEANMLKQYRYEIENETPIVNLDFTAINV
ncbi:phosphotransferase enzyme family protein [Melghirimyces algeriensis]|uniref:phosphotransferase enzyme family protein n=1 Tax=Melghirimyces algeriensis TaxID=910412 RepID=UPI00115C2036|nr:phosphotransferase [Melghirimyces algeriensis]